MCVCVRSCALALPRTHAPGHRAAMCIGGRAPPADRGYRIGGSRLLLSCSAALLLWCAVPRSLTGSLTCCPHPAGVRARRRATAAALQALFSHRKCVCVCVCVRVSARALPRTHAPGRRAAMCIGDRAPPAGRAPHGGGPRLPLSCSAALLLWCAVPRSLTGSLTCCPHPAGVRGQVGRQLDAARARVPDVQRGHVAG